MSERLSILAATEAEKLPNSAGSLAPIIAVLIPIIADLIIGCFDDPERAASEARRPGLIARWRLRREIRGLVPDDDADSVQVREHLFNAVLAAGKTATASDFGIADRE